MDKHKIEHVKYNCSVVNNTVNLNLKYTIIGCDQASTYKTKLIDFDCGNKLNCRVATAQSNGSTSFDWNLCPAYKEKVK